MNSNWNQNEVIDISEPSDNWISNENVIPNINDKSSTSADSFNLANSAEVEENQSKTLEVMNHNCTRCNRSF